MRLSEVPEAPERYKSMKSRNGGDVMATPNRELAWREGYKAAVNGIGKNPHPVTHPTRHRAWKDGYQAGLDAA